MDTDGLMACVALFTLDMAVYALTNVAGTFLSVAAVYGYMFGWKASVVPMVSRLWYTKVSVPVWQIAVLIIVIAMFAKEYLVR